MPSNRACPEPLLDAWLRHAMHITGSRDPRTAIHKLERDAGLLSDTFTTGREPDFSGYRNSKRSLAAYGLFFFPRTYVRTRLVLDECAANWSSRASHIRVVDIGAGTGAAGLAALETLTAWRPEAGLQLDMVDCATEGIDLSRSIFSAGHALWPRARVREIKTDAQTYTPETGTHLMLCSFAINEWMMDQADDQLHEWVARQMKSLAPGGWLVIMEPALRSAVERMERLRDWIAAEKIARILAPCPHHAPCPMLAEKRGWCHEVRTWRVPDSLRRINRTLQRDVHLLKFSFLALQNAPVESSNWMRLVSPVKMEKGKYVCHGCGGDGRLHHVEWLTRNLSEEQKAFSELLERGDRVAMPRGVLLGDGKTERVDEALARIQ